MIKGFLEVKMGRQYYDKAKPKLMKDFISLYMKLQKGQTFTKTWFIAEFNEKYPLFRKSAIERSLCRLSVNDRNRKIYEPSEDDDVLWKVDGHTYRLYDKDTDIIGQIAAKSNTKKPSPNVSKEESFKYEKSLRDFLTYENHLFEIEEGLKLYINLEGRNGIEYPAGDSGRIDILAKDKEDNFVVIELKAGKSQKGVVEQLLGYMSWIEENLEKSNKKVRGIIICKEISKKLQRVCKSLSDIMLKEYSLVTKVKNIN
jgi:hypothetical protein